MEQYTPLQVIAVMALPLLFAITLHEVAHGWVAWYSGDPTAKRQGRLSLNPLKHIDLVGTIIVPIMMYLTTPYLFGWAKPVPVNWNLLRNPRRDMTLVALAGPAANFVMALFWAIVAKITLIVSGGHANPATVFFYNAGITGIFINVLLMTLNLLPIPPLDGSKVLLSLLSPRLAYKVARYESYGLLILALLLITGTLWQVLLPPIKFINRFILNLLVL